MRSNRPARKRAPNVCGQCTVRRSKRFRLVVGRERQDKREHNASNSSYQARQCNASSQDVDSLRELLNGVSPGEANNLQSADQKYVTEPINICDFTRLPMKQILLESLIRMHHCRTFCINKLSLSSFYLVSVMLRFMKSK